MIRTGTVVKQEHSGVLVSFERLAACHGCNACGREKQTTTVFVPGNARQGDRVSVQIPDVQVLKASALMYLIPLIGLVAGLFIGGAATSGRDLGMVVGGLIGLIISALLLKMADKRLGKRSAWQPRIVAVNPEQEIDETFLCDKGNSQP